MMRSGGGESDDDVSFDARPSIESYTNPPTARFRLSSPSSNISNALIAKRLALVLK